MLINIVDKSEPIVENTGNNVVHENILLNAEIDPVDIVPGSSVMHVDVSDEEMEVSAPCSDVIVTDQRRSSRRPFSCTESGFVSNCFRYIYLTNTCRDLFIAIVSIYIYMCK